MSDWVQYRDRPNASAIETAARVVVAQPGLFTSALVAQCAPHTSEAVRVALQKLRWAKLARNEKQSGRPGRGKAGERRWFPLPALVERVARNEPIVLSRRLRADGRYALDEIEDDGWTPPTHYVTAAQLYARGLKRDHGRVA